MRNMKCESAARHPFCVRLSKAIYIIDFFKINRGIRVKTTTLETLHKSFLTCFVLVVMGCTATGSLVAQSVNNGGAITATELQQNGYPYPNDLVAGASQTQLANYAWRLFIASMQQTTASLQSGAGRGVGSPSVNFIGTGQHNALPNPLVFESLYHRTEAFPYYTDGNRPPSPINRVPTYYSYTLDANENRVPFTVSGQHYVNLDETNEIGQNFLYYRDSNDPDFPVLFMAKVNAIETNYAYTRDAPSSQSSWVFPNNVLEVKTAWRRVRDIKNSDSHKYHWAQASYYVGDENSGNPSIETDTFALIAIHIIQKTANYQHFIFSTFEHVDSVTRDSAGNITDPAFQLTYDTLAYDSGSSNPHTATAVGAYSSNVPGLAAQSNAAMTYTLPNAGPAPQGYVTVVQPKTISSEVNDVNNQVLSELISLDSNSIWANYRLKGVQAVPTSDQQSLDYYLANIVVESSQPGIQLFRGNAGGGLPVNGTFTNNRMPGNVSTNLVEGQPVPSPSYTMGGCMGCHGIAQQRGRDFSFLAQSAGGNGKETDSVPSEDLTFLQKALHNQRMAETNNFGY